MIENLLRQYGYVIVYLGSLVEPDATLVAASFLARREYFHLASVWLLATLGTVTASHFWFWLARSRGRHLLSRITESNPRYEKVRGWVERNSTILIFAARFLWGTRIAITAACGASGVHPVRFVVVDAAGALVWTAVVGTVGFAIARAVGRAFQFVKPYHDAVALAIVGLVALVALWKRLEARHEIRDVLHPGQLGIDALEHLDRRVARTDDR